MSLLLQALRKSEQRRNNGQPPTLQLPVGAPTGDRSSRRAGSRRWPVFLVLLAVLATAAWWALGRPGWPEAAQRPAGPTPQAAAASVPQAPGGERAEAAAVEAERALQVDAYQRPSPTPAAARPDEPVARVNAAPGRADRRDGPDRGSQPAVDGGGGPSAPAADAPPSVSRLEPELDSPEARARRAARAQQALAAERGARAAALEPIAPAGRENSARGDAPADSSRRGPEPADLSNELPDPPGEASVSAEDNPRNNAIDPWELPSALRSEFPGVEISVHVFAPDPASRFVLIGGERYGEGDELADGVRLAEIHRGGVIVEFRDYRIWIE
jgi:general secretion pathway protein B